MVVWDPHPYQSETVDMAVSDVSADKGIGALLDPGLGKTSIMLEIFRTMRITHGVERMLIIAPLRVCHAVWRQEAAKWDQFRKFKFAVVHGSTTARRKALRENADIFLVPFSQVKWLTEEYGDAIRDCFDVLAIDESSQIKSHKSVRFKACKLIASLIAYRFILTGTPTPHSLCDLWSQIYVLDFGRRLGKTITSFRDAYCTSSGFRGHSFKVRDSAVADVMEQVRDIAVSLRAVDHLKLPPLTHNTINVELPPKARVFYDKFEAELFASLDEFKHDGDLIARGTTYVKCRQIANGQVYYERSQDEKDMAELHREKITAIAELLDELNHKPAIVAYSYNTDLSQLLREFGAKVPAIRGGMDPNEVNRIIDRWNGGDLKLLFVQPQSLSYGVNMQSGPGRDIIWMQPPDMGELDTQLNARIWRQGVDSEVRIHRIITTETVDELAASRLNAKLETQETLLNSLRRYRDAKRG